MYIIGDVHGSYKTLLKLISKIPKNEKIVFLGDLIDRGPNSRKVINLIRDNNYDCVQGNHESLMYDYFIDNKQNSWLGNGGRTTYHEYINNKYIFDDKAFKKDVLFLKNLPKYILYDIYDEQNRQLIISHASLSDYFNSYLNSIDKIKDKNTSKYDLIEYIHYKTNAEELMIWNRREPINYSTQYFNIFGHTPIDVFKRKVDDKYFTNGIILNKDKGYADIDTGACYPDKEYRGLLTAISFPDFHIIQQKNIDY